MLKSIGAFMVAPFPAATVQAMVVAIWPKQGQGIFENPPSMLAALCLYFYIFGLILGLPTWYLARRSLTGMRAYALLGLFVGLTPVGMALVYWISQGQASTYAVAYNALLFGLGGLVAGALFWFIARRAKRVETLEATFS